MKRTIILVYPRIRFEENYPCSWIPYSVLAIASSLPTDKYHIVIFDENRKSAPDFEELLVLYSSSVYSPSPRTVCYTVGDTVDWSAPPTT